VDRPPRSAEAAHQIIAACSGMLLDRHLVVSGIVSCMQDPRFLNLFFVSVVQPSPSPHSPTKHFTTAKEIEMFCTSGFNSMKPVIHPSNI
jgi:hypothetical protein